MKTFFITAALLFSAQSLQAKTLIVSDVDDTIKMSDVLGKTSHLVYNSLLRQKAFSGMSELFNSMRSPDTTFFYVSGSPRIIKSRVNEFLEENKFPQDENIILKEFSDPDTHGFKVKAIRYLIKEQQPDTLILIGDDTQHDPEVYRQISEEFPEIVKGVYIHVIQDREVFGTPFLSAVEIGVHELNEGRLDLKFLPAITFGFTKQTNGSGVVLKNRYCPKDGRDEILELKQKATDKVVIESLEKTQNKIIKSCNKLFF